MKNYFIVLIFFMNLLMVPYCLAQTPLTNGGAVPVKLFDIEVSAPLNFLGTQDEQMIEGPSYYNFALPNKNLGLQANLDYYLASDLLLGLYYQRLDKYIQSRYYPDPVSGVLSDVGVNGFGLRIKKEFLLSDRFGFDPFLGFGIYFLDGNIEDAHNDFILSGSQLGGEIGLGIVYYLNDQRDLSLELEGGYRKIVIDSVTGSDLSQSYYFHLLNNDGASASLDFSGWFVNFLELKATLTQGSPQTTPEKGSSDTWFVKAGGGLLFNGDYYFWGDNLTASLAWGVEFLDGFSLFADGECFTGWNSRIAGLSITANIEYKPTFFNKINPYLYCGVGTGLWGSSFGLDIQIGLGSEIELSPELNLFIEAKSYADETLFGNVTTLRSFYPIQTGLKFKL